MNNKDRGYSVLWKIKTEDVEAYQKIKAMMLSPMKINGEDIESYESIKTEDVESYLNIKTKDVESYEK